MTKVEFLRRWAKKATEGGAVEAFEVDLEKLSKSIVMVTTSAIVNGMLQATEKMPKRDRERFRGMIRQVQPAIQQALIKLYQ